ncbi:MAG: hypothetical protein QOD44_3560 [Solirubrobacteraceae bacterium]|nr:hypothetical protein [Solirubrobacteraceae bacterium]
MALDDGLLVPRVQPDGVVGRAGTIRDPPAVLRPLLKPPATPEPAARRPTSERDLLRAIAAGTAGVVGDAFLRALVRHLADAFHADLAYVAEDLDAPPGRVRVVASWHRGDARLPEGTEYDVAGSPCALANIGDVVALPEGACARFGAVPLIAAHRLDGYLAVPMHGTGGTHLGHVTVMSRSRLEATEDEIAVLTIFAARAAAEIERRRHAATLRTREAEIAASRARMVQAADAERGRIGRDLHDGAQQRLLALGHLATLAQRRLVDRPGEAAMLLEQVREEATLAHTELRELARGLHPAGLAERGLAGALDALAGRSPLPVQIDGVPERRLPDPVAVTVYYLVSEALANAIRHASASELRVQVGQRDREVVIDVCDDGTGGAVREEGGGLAGLGDRVAALGGTLEIVSPPGGGTRLVASIPLAPWRTASEPFLEFGYEGDEGVGERLIEQVRTGAKRVSVCLAREWDLEGGPPRIGQILPIHDHAGRGRGAVEVLQVTELPFAKVGEDVVAADDGIRDLPEWRARHRHFYDACRDEMAFLLGEPGWRLTDEEPMIALFYRFAEEPASQERRAAARPSSRTGRPGRDAPAT